MAAESTKSAGPVVLAQNTGNPVLDTTANLMMAWLARSKAPSPLDKLEALYERVLKLAHREPNGLRRTSDIS